MVPLAAAFAEMLNLHGIWLPEMGTNSCALSLLGSLSKFAAEEAEEEEEEEQEEKKAMVVIDKERVRILQERRCDSKGRGAVYDPVLGICCHFCR